MNHLFIINPVSGKKKGEAIFKKIRPSFDNSHINVKSIVSVSQGHIYNIAQSYDFRSLEAVVLIGGDGSLHEFVNGMLDRTDGEKIAIGLIPAGTGNALMHDLDLLDPFQAAQKVLDNSRMKMDVAKVDYNSTHVYSINVVGWGLSSTINQKAEALKIFGPQRYNLASLSEIIRNPNWPVKIKVDDEIKEGNYTFFLACNTIHTGNAMKIAPMAKLNDGLFDVVILKQASRYKLIKLFTKIFNGSHLDSPLVEYGQSKAFSIEDGKSSVLIVDGQIIGSTPFSANVIKGAIEIFC